MNDLNDINGMYLEARASMVPNTRTIDDITGEIIELQERTQRLVLGYAVEIGRRLTEAKEMLKHGEWLPWLRDSVHFSERTAQRMMKLYDAYGAAQIGIFGAELNTTRVSDLSYTKALALIALPENERDEFADRHDLQAMSTRELEAAIKEREELKRQLEEVTENRDGLVEQLHSAHLETKEQEAALDKAVEQFNAQKRELQELRSRPVEVAVQEPDPEEMKRLIDEAVKKAEADFAAKRTELEQKAVSAENALQKAREALEAAEKKGESEIGPYKAEIDSMKAETERLRRELRASGADTARFKVWFNQAQSCWQNMQAIVVECADKETALKLKGAMDALLKSWGAA